MGKLRLSILFALLSIACHGQLIGIVAASSGYRGSSEKTYVSIPDPPAFSDTHTLVQATTGTGIQSGDTGGKTDFLISGDYDFMQFQNLSGNYRLKSIDSTDPSTFANLGLPAPNDYSFSAVTATPGIELYNVNLIDSDNTFKMPGASPVKTYKFQNVNILRSTFGGWLINEDVAGKNYGSVEMYFCTGFKTGGEFVYYGNTGLSSVDFVGTTYVHHCFTDSSGREGLQFNNHYTVRVDHVTLLHCGQDTGSGIGQNNAIQCQGIGDLEVKNSILYGRAPGMFATNKAKLRNLDWEWTETNRPIYFQDISTNNYHNENVTPDTIFVEDSDLRCIGYTLPYVFRIQEENAVYVFRRLTLPPSATDIYTVDGAAPIAIITEDITFEVTARPTFGPPPETAYIGYHLVPTDDRTYNLGRGFRNPINP